MKFMGVGNTYGTPVCRWRAAIVLNPDPRYVRTLLARYASARIALAEKSEPAWQRELDDVTYTLCVVTGSRSIADALAAADALLAKPAASGTTQTSLAA
ncbi:DUF5133 domain-containing protein [Streptomyces sp. CB03234]|uniref:DUF5133 domain-containing protein n=1 Tax=Streptomyces sp. (strain CB03234) TaxID=1703937 RepID=UPI0026909471